MRARDQGPDSAVGDVGRVGTMSFAVANIGEPVKARLIGGRGMLTCGPVGEAHDLPVSDPAAALAG